MPSQVVWLRLNRSLSRKSASAPPSQRRIADVHSECLYEVLGVDMDFTPELLRKKYRKLALKYHPDKHVMNQDMFTRVFQRINLAYQTLSDPAARARYDRTRSA